MQVTAGKAGVIRHFLLRALNSFSLGVFTPRHESLSPTTLITAVRFTEFRAYDESFVGTVQDIESARMNPEQETEVMGLTAGGESEHLITSHREYESF